MPTATRPARKPSSKAKPATRRRGGARALLWINVLLAGCIGTWFFLQPKERRDEVVHLLGNYLQQEKHIRLPDVAWDLYQLYHGEAFVPAPVSTGESHVLAGLPFGAAQKRPLRLLFNIGYTVGYNERLGNPAWVAYRSFDLARLRAAPSRPDRFEIDRRTIARVSPDDYSGSGYDRGHLAPNHVIATRYGEAAQRETFLMSNIVPQRHALNAGAWRELEQRIASSYPARFQEVWVIAGPIFPPSPVRLGNTAVPEAFFMIIADESAGRLRVLAFVFDQDFPTTSNLASALTTVDVIEARTGLDFFHLLEEEAEAALESRRASRVW